MKFFYPAIVLIFFTSCSTSSIVKNNTNSSNTNLNNSNFAAVAQPNSNIEVQPPANVVKIQSPAISKENADSWENKKGGSGERPAPIAAIPLTTAAPDNSEISGTMDNEGTPVETRTFKNNPLLAKVVKIYTDAKNPQVKIYLKNGKVLNLPPGKIGNPSTASANEILTAIGAIPKVVPQKNESKAEIEKKEQ